MICKREEVLGVLDCPPAGVLRSPAERGENGFKIRKQEQTGYWAEESPWWTTVSDWHCQSARYETAVWFYLKKP